MASRLKTDTDWYRVAQYIIFFTILCLITVIHLTIWLAFWHYDPIPILTLRIFRLFVIAFLILFSVSWTWNGLNEFLLVNKWEPISRSIFVWVFKISLFILSLLLMACLGLMFVFSDSIRCLSLLFTIYTAGDILFWIARRKYLSLVLSPEDDMYTYYQGKRHIKRTSYQLALLAVIFIASQFESNELAIRSSVVIVEYILFILIVTYSEAIIQYWRTESKNSIANNKVYMFLKVKYILLIDYILKALLYLLFILVLLVAMFWLASLLIEHFTYGVSRIYDIGGRKALVVAVLILGLVAYLLRLFYRLWYGVLELWIAASIINVTSPQDWRDATPQSTLQIAGGLFILIRGLDNAYEGFRKAPWGGIQIARFGRLPRNCPGFR